MLDKIKHEILSLNEIEFALYSINESHLNKKTVEVIFQYILNHYDCKIYIIDNRKIIVLNRKDINTDLLDLFHDLSIVCISQIELKTRKYIQSN